MEPGRTSKGMTRGEKIILFCVVIPITIIFILVWHFDLAYFIPHVATARVHSNDWVVGQYQDCLVVNEKSNEEEPELICSSHASEEPETLKVRFYGRTFDPEQPGPTDLFLWRCRKNAGTNPSITCDHERRGTFPSPRE